MADQLYTDLEQALARQQATVVAEPAGAKGQHIKSFVRVRPFNDVELQRGESMCTELDQTDGTITVSGAKRRFRFDGVFGEASGNQEVYEAVGLPVVRSALCGFNGTLLAYGQTGTGKTHTLTCADGLLPRIVASLFQHIAHNPRFDFVVRMDYVQIYQEKIYDLLSDAQTQLSVREEPGVGLRVHGSQNLTIKDASDFFTALDEGRRRLKFASTKMNRHSSRSHAVCILELERTPAAEACEARERLSRSLGGVHRSSLLSRALSQVNFQISRNPLCEGSEVDDCDVPSAETVCDHEAGHQDEAGLRASWSRLMDSEELSHDAVDDTADDHVDGAIDMMLEGVRRDVVVRGRLTLVDLAGSERIKKTGASGERLAEAKHINLSLHELGNCISALAKGSGHVPFRNSMLTRLLQESLGGNCKTCLVVCVSPGEESKQETLSSLEFGSRAMSIQNAPRVNVEMDFKIVADELQQLLQQRAEEWTALQADYERRIADLMRCEQTKIEAATQSDTAAWEDAETQCTVSSAEQSVQCGDAVQVIRDTAVAVCSPISLPHSSVAVQASTQMVDSEVQGEASLCHETGLITPPRPPTLEVKPQTIPGCVNLSPAAGTPIARLKIGEAAHAYAPAESPSLELESELVVMTPPTSPPTTGKGCCCCHIVWGY